MNYHEENKKLNEDNNKINIDTMYTSSLMREQNLTELEDAFIKSNMVVLGLSEVRRSADKSLSHKEPIYFTMQATIQVKEEWDSWLNQS